jgi:hypothetical protein
MMANNRDSQHVSGGAGNSPIVRDSRSYEPGKPIRIRMPVPVPTSYTHYLLLPAL